MYVKYIDHDIHVVLPESTTALSVLPFALARAASASATRASLARRIVRRARVHARATRVEVCQPPAQARARTSERAQAVFSAG
jgi:hypothetical protein